MDYTGFINTRANHRVSHAAEIHAKNFVAALMQAPPTRGPEGSPPHSRVAIQQKMMQLEHKVQNTLAKRQARQKLEKEGDDGNRLENRVQQLERLVRDKEQQALRDALCQKETAGRTAITQIEHAEWVQVQHEHWAVKTNILADANYYEEQVVRKALINLEQDIRGDLKQKMEVKLAVVKQHAMLRDAQVRRQRQQAEDLEERNRMRLVAQIQLEISEYLLPGVEEAQTLHRAVVIRTATEAHERIFQKKRVAELAPEFVRNRDKWLEGIQAQQQMVVLSAELGARLSIVTEARTLGVALLDGVVTGEEFGRAWLLQQQDAQAQALAGSFCSDAAQIRRSAISKDWETKARQLVAKEAAAFAQITLLFEETAQRTELSAALTRVLSGSILGLVGLEEVYYRLAHSAKEDWQAQLLWCQILESETRTILGAEATQGMLVRVLSFAELEEQRCRLALQESEVAKLPLIGCQSEECQRRASIAEEWWEGCVQINKATVEECSSQRSADSAAHEMANRRALVDKAAHTYATIQHDFLLGCEELGRKGVIREACVAELQHLVEAESFALRLQMAAECSARTSVLAQAQAEVAELQIKAQSVSWAANLEVQIDAESVARAAVLEEEQKVAAQLQPRRDFSGSLDAEKALELQVCIVGFLPVTRCRNDDPVPSRTRARQLGHLEWGQVQARLLPPTCILFHLSLWVFSTSRPAGFNRTWVRLTYRLGVLIGSADFRPADRPAEGTV